MDYLTHFESFSVGIDLGVYDYAVFIKMASDNLCKNLFDLVGFIEFKRNDMNYDLLFDESLKLINHIQFIQGRKKAKQKINVSIRNIK